MLSRCPDTKEVQYLALYIIPKPIKCPWIPGQGIPDLEGLGIEDEPNLIEMRQPGAIRYNDYRGFDGLQ